MYVLPVQSCHCDGRRNPMQCKALARRMGVSVHALIAILLCILTILGMSFSLLFSFTFHLILVTFLIFHCTCWLLHHKCLLITFVKPFLF